MHSLKENFSLPLFNMMFQSGLASWNYYYHLQYTSLLTKLPSKLSLRNKLYH